MIIATYSRPQPLRECLEALAALEPPGCGTEVVIVDDGSRPPIDAILAPFRERLSLVHAYQPNGGPARARNLGARLARGEHLVFLDDDCCPPPDWLKNVLAAVERHPEAALGGHTVNRLRDNHYAVASQLLVDYLYEQHRHCPAERFFTANNLIVPARQFSEVGGFDESFKRAAGEDREFASRWLHHGFELVYDPRIQIHHAHRLGLRTFLRQHFTYGRAALDYWRARLQRPGKGFFLEGPSFYLGMIAFPLRRSEFSLARRLRLVGLMVLTQIANAAGFFFELATEPLKGTRPPARKVARQ